MRRSTVIAASCAGVVAVGGWLYQLAGQRRDERRFPPPGRLVDVGGRRLHVVRTGAEGSGPVVVVLPALGTPALEWHRVFDALLENITAYAVDRGGVGWSDPVPCGPRTPMVLAEEVTALLDALELTSVVLVGHSYGGIVARVVAARDRRVAGLVLVDSSHEDQMRPLAAADPEISAHELWWDAARRQAVPLGWFRVWHDLRGRQGLIRAAVDEVGSRMAPAAAARSLTTARRRAVVGELLGLALAARVTPVWARRLGDLPTTVLTVGDGNGWGPAAYPVWLELQRSLAAMSSRSRHLVMNGTGHHMNRDVPAQVAAAIVNLVAEVCGRARSAEAGSRDRLG